MGVHTSFVRSTSMDTWNEKQLKMMALGGNKKLKEHFSKYDISDESVQQRYNTRAAQFYRLQIRNACENIPFNE
jgi:ADP-ribosylation factor GTPase-activating protein 1